MLDWREVMAFSEEILADIKKRNIEVTDKDLAEFERQNVNGEEDIDFGDGDTSLSDTTARVHVAAMDDLALREHARRSLRFEELSLEEMNEISAAIYIASIKKIPIDKKVIFLQLKKLYEKKFFKSLRYLFSSQKAKAHAATAYMVGSFSRTNEGDISKAISDQNTSDSMAVDVKPIDRYNEDGYTPLMRAVKAMDIDAVITLIEQGANPSIKDENFGTSTALSMAMLFLKRAKSTASQQGFQQIVDELEKIK